MCARCAAAEHPKPGRAPRRPRCRRDAHHLTGDEANRTMLSKPTSANAGAATSSQTSVRNRGARVNRRRADVRGGVGLEQLTATGCRGTGWTPALSGTSDTRSGHPRDRGHRIVGQTRMIWYGADGQVIKSIGNFAKTIRVIASPKPAPRRRSRERPNATHRHQTESSVTPRRGATHQPHRRPPRAAQRCWLQLSPVRYQLAGDHRQPRPCTSDATSSSPSRSLVGHADRRSSIAHEHSPTTDHEASALLRPTSALYPEKDTVPISISDHDGFCFATLIGSSTTETESRALHNRVRSADVVGLSDQLCRPWLVGLVGQSISEASRRSVGPLNTVVVVLGGKAEALYSWEPQSAGRAVTVGIGRR